MHKTTTTETAVLHASLLFKSIVVEFVVELVIELVVERVVVERVVVVLPTVLLCALVVLSTSLDDCN
jgi:hypothetical protein